MERENGPAWPWAAATLAGMSLEEKVRQLFMMGAVSSYSDQEVNDTISLVRDGRIGGLIFMVGEPMRQVEMTNAFQRAAAVPLLVAQDSEWGLSMRLRGTPVFPRNAALGAIPAHRERLLLEFGRAVGEQCRRIGVHVNFAPVVDVNNNPRNPVIGDRSFGERPDEVARCAAAVARGMREGGAVNCAKHFPGHGDTDVDSHLDLPVIRHSLERLRAVEMAPFRALVRDVDSVMVAHLHVPSVDPTEGLPLSLSRPCVTGLLREELGFDGLVFTDSLTMMGVAKRYGMAEAGLMALLAGSDVLLYTVPHPDPKEQARIVDEATALILAAVKDGRLAESEVNRRAARVLETKERLGLPSSRLVPGLESAQELFSDTQRRLKRELYRAAVTLVSDPARAVPLKSALHLLALGHPQAGEPRLASALARLLPYPVSVSSSPADAGVRPIVAALFLEKEKLSALPGSPLLQGVQAQLAALPAPPAALVLFGSPYLLALAPAALRSAAAVLVAYDEDGEAQEAAAQVLAGVHAPSGSLPVTVD
eukprot:tig00020553_g10587.t1